MTTRNQLPVEDGPPFPKKLRVNNDNDTDRNFLVCSAILSLWKQHSLAALTLKRRDDQHQQQHQPHDPVPNPLAAAAMAPDQKNKRPANERTQLFLQRTLDDAEQAEWLFQSVPNPLVQQQQEEGTSTRTRKRPLPVFPNFPLFPRLREEVSSDATGTDSFRNADENKEKDNVQAQQPQLGFREEDYESIGCSDDDDDDENDTEDYEGTSCCLNSLDDSTYCNCDDDDENDYESLESFSSSTDDFAEDD